MVAGSWDETDPGVLATANSLGAWLAKRGHWILTGGGTGIADACSDGARVAGGVAVAFHPGSRATMTPDDGQHTLTVYTESGWDGRSLAAVKSCDVLIAVGGHAGTLLEIVLAYLNAVPVMVLAGSSEMARRLELFLVDGRHIDVRRTSEVQLVKSIGDLQSMLDIYAK